MTVKSALRCNSDMHKRKKLLMVGNGMAGVRTLEELLKIAPDQYDISVFGSENHGNYNRIMLSPVLANELTVDDIITHTPQWYADNNITLYRGKTVTKIDRNRSTVILDDGAEYNYDRLLIATGSRPFILPVPGKELEGVVAYRDIDDVQVMLAAAKQHKKAIVIGGGLLGLEAANGLNKQGMDVTVVHLADYILERQLDPKAAGLLQSFLEQQGISFKLQAMTEKLSGEERVEKIHFKDNTELNADLVVMAAGIIPRAELAKDSGLPCERGILVDDCMQTYDPKIYAVGECGQHRGVAYGLVAPLFDQAKVCANHLAEMGIAQYGGTVLSTKLKVTGVNLFSAGEFMGDDTTEELIFNDVDSEIYKKLVIKDQSLVGAVMYGETQDGTWYFDLIQSGESIAEFRDNLIFGRGLCVDTLAEAI